MIKYTEGINHYGEIIKKIDKNITLEGFPVCGADEDWECLMLCKNSKENRKE